MGRFQSADHGSIAARAGDNRTESAAVYGSVVAFRRHCGPIEVPMTGLLFVAVAGYGTVRNLRDGESDRSVQCPFTLFKQPLSGQIGSWRRRFLPTVMLVQPM